jgi:NADP-reducing hydrogenase subunit HndB
MQRSISRLMTAIQSLEDLERFKQEVIAKKNRLSQSGKIQVAVSMGSCGIAAGANSTFLAALKQIESLQLKNVVVSKIGCIGHCSEEPILQVITSDGQKTTYGHASADIVEKIFRKHVIAGEIVHEHQISI